MKQIRQSMVSALCLIAFGGCSVGPDFTPPKTQLPSAWKGEENASSQMLNRWWEKFEDPALNALVEQALENNKEIAVAAARNEGFMARLGITEASLWPQIEAGASATRQEQSSKVANRSASFNKRSTTYGLNAGMNAFEIDFWGKYARANEAAKAALLESDYNRQVIRTSVAANVVSAYISLATQYRLLENGRKNRQLAQEIASIAQAKWDLGVGSYGDLLQALGSSDEVSSQIPPIEAKIAELENAMAVLTGQMPGSLRITPPKAPFEEVNVPPGLPSELLRRRPDILAAEASWHAANASIGVAKGEYFPSFSLTALFGYQSAELSTLIGNPARMWQLTPAVTLPIFTAGRIGSQVNLAEAQTKEAQSAYEQTLLGAFGEVENALSERRALEEQNRLLVSAHAKMAQAETITKAEYENGKSGYLPLLVARMSLLSSENRLIRNEEERSQNIVTLCKALGGGWER